VANKDPDAVIRSVFCVLELVHDRHRGKAGGIECMVSIPGREGIMTKRWSAPEGRLSSSQAKDLLAWVELTCNNALLAWTGVQGELPIG
jgi:hypothetical protein